MKTLLEWNNIQQQKFMTVSSASYNYNLAIFAIDSMRTVQCRLICCVILLVTALLYSMHTPDAYITSNASTSVCELQSLAIWRIKHGNATTE